MSLSNDGPRGLRPCRAGFLNILLCKYWRVVVFQDLFRQRTYDCFTHLLIVAVRPILQYPDPLLKQVCQPIAPDDPDVNTIVQDMLETLEASPGVALAAPQIGYAVQIIVIDVSRKPGEAGHGLIVLLNPRVIDQSDRRVLREGCLSVPEYTGNVLRYRRTVVEGISPEGRPTTIAASGLEALAFQHELDHLQGTLFLDRIQSLSTDLFRRKQGGTTG